MNVAPERILFIGDSLESDIKGSINAGMIAGYLKRPVISVKSEASFHKSNKNQSSISTSNTASTVTSITESVDVIDTTKTEESVTTITSPGNTMIETSVSSSITKSVSVTAEFSSNVLDDSIFDYNKSHYLVLTSLFPDEIMIKFKEHNDSKR